MSYGKDWRHGAESGRASRNSIASATSAPSSRQGRNSVSGQSQGQVPTAKKEANPPFGLTFRIPEDCVFFEPPLVARWEFTEKVWKTSDLEEMTYDEETKTYSFKTFKFGPIACMQDKHINFPFQSWELRPLTGNSALFTINGALVDVEIEIQGDKCCLRKPADMPQLEGIIGQWIVPKELIKFMKSKGVNIFPDEDSRKYVMNSYKHTWIEANLYQQMALCSHVLAFSYSKWNTESGEKRLVLQAAEATVGQPVSEDAWGIFLMTSKRVMALKMKESEQGFSEELREGTEIMSNFYHMAQHIGSEGLIQRLKSVDYSFIKAVKELLDATQLITFA